MTTSPRNVGLPPEGGNLFITELFLEIEDPDHLQVVYSSGHVFETQDAGISWSLLFALDLEGASLEDVSWDPASGHVFLATSGAGVVTSHPLVSPAGLPTADVRSVYFAPSKQILYAGTEAAGLWHQVLGSVVGAPELSEMLDGTLRVRPNPFRPGTTIEFTVSESGAAIDLTVFDAAGRVVRVLERGWAAGGERSVSWDARDRSGRPLPSGVYFVRLQVGGETRTQKAVLRR
jgi:hypothetical protein